MSMQWGRIIGTSVLFMGTDHKSSTRVMLVGSLSNVIGIDPPTIREGVRVHTYFILLKHSAFSQKVATLAPLISGLMLKGVG